MDFQQLGGTWAADWGPGGPTWPSLVPDASPMRRKVPKRALALGTTKVDTGMVRFPKCLLKMGDMYVYVYIYIHIYI
jgi:hypothetical protein